MNIRNLAFTLALLLCASLYSPAADPGDTTYLRFNTNLGYIDPHSLAQRWDLSDQTVVLDGMATLLASLVAEAG